MLLPVTVPYQNLMGFSIRGAKVVIFLKRMTKVRGKIKAKKWNADTADFLRDASFLYGLKIMKKDYPISIVELYFALKLSFVFSL